MAVILQKSSPLLPILLGHIPVRVNQGFDVFKVGDIEGMDAKFGLRKKVVKNEMVLMGMRGDQIIYDSFALKLL